VDTFHLKKKSKLEISWLIQLANRTKGRINEVVRGCPIDQTELNTIVDLNIILLGCCDILIGMDWLDNHKVVLDFHNKIFICLSEERKQNLVKWIARPISIRDISTL
jgi:hypothetical protein